MNTDWTEAMLRILMESSVRAVIVAAVAAGVLQVFRVQGSSVRHAAWTGVLVLMILMPVLPQIVPAIEVPIQAPARVHGLHHFCAYAHLFGAQCFR